MTAVSKNIYFVLDDIANEYNNTVHRTMKIKPIDIRSDSYAEYNEDSNEKDPKFKAGDHLRIWKYKNIFATGYTQNWSEEIFIISKIKNTVLWTYVISDVNGEPIAGSFHEKWLQKTSQQKFRIEKWLRRQMANWMPHGKDNLFNSLINKKTLNEIPSCENESILS